ncbi:hypothetical protein Q5O89_16650 [Peribacillus frigoritolerans]|nr:hypothetical protein [Peribacillus frigoritolerans]
MINEYGKFEQLVKKLDQGNKLIRAWELIGGISAQVTGLEILQSSGRIVKMIVRQHGDNDLKRNPNIAAYEHKLLMILKAAGLPVPMPYNFEQSCEIFPSHAYLSSLLRVSQNSRPQILMIISYNWQSI